MPTGVQFENDWRPQHEGPPPPSGLVKFAIKHLGAKDEHAANTILLGIAVVFFGATFFVIFRFIL